MLTLKLLGKPQIALDGKPVSGFISAKSQALLFYLAVTARPHTRETLAGLLWSDVPEAQAGKNLRNVLSNLRSLIGVHVLITREDVAFNSGSHYELDVDDFTRAMSGDASKQDLGTLHHAVELYQGDFLAGFYVSDALPFEEWGLGQQALLKNLALQALHTLVVKHLEREEYAAGIDYANRLLTIGPWHEETHRHLMILLARSGQRSAALAQYDICRRTLLNELGVEPLPETTALYTRIKAAAAPPPHNLPPQPTPFVGREAELAEVARFVHNPDAQLLTLIGPGGIGKTRLALQAAARAIDPAHNIEQNFPDGVFFVPLIRAAGSAAQLPLVSALAEALRIELQGPLHPQVQLLGHLRDKKMLLILDNFDHLTAEAPQLADLLRLAPGIKLLVTSRVRLNLQEEWLLEVRGLDFPTGAAGPLELGNYSALRLFIQQARRMQPGFTLLDAEMQSAIRICQLVEGAPLGIELAASWLRILSCAEIAREIETSLDFLTTPLHNVPERHRSLRVVFDYSWNLLRPDEQAVLRKLAVFHGGFEREAAAQIARASLPMLATLVDNSLLRRTSTGRYEIHEVLRQYAEEALRRDGAEYVQVRDAHCRYYAELLLQHKTELKSNELPPVTSVLDQERENVRAAWNWAVSQRRAAEVDMFMECL